MSESIEINAGTQGKLVVVIAVGLESIELALDSGVMLGSSALHHRERLGDPQRRSSGPRHCGGGNLMTPKENPLPWLWRIVFSQLHTSKSPSQGPPMRMSPQFSHVWCLCLASALLAFPFGCGPSDAGGGGGGGGTGGNAGEGGTGGSGGQGGTGGSGGQGGTGGSGGQGGIGGSGGEGGVGGSSGTGGTPEGYNKTWRGSVSNEWFEPLNWEPEGVPVSTDNVYISPDAPGQPDRTRDAISVNDLLIPEGASFTNSSAVVRVRVFGDLDATGGIDGSGPIILLGGTIKGTVHRVEVWEPSSLSGDTTITDRISITEVVDDDDDASLALSGHTLTAQNFSCCSNGAIGLIMEDPADRLVVEGELAFCAFDDVDSVCRSDRAPGRRPVLRRRARELPSARRAPTSS